MTQLILDAGGVNLILPEVKLGGYVCEKKPLSKDLEMASGRLVREIRGSYYQIRYEQTLLTELNRAAFLSVCAAGSAAAIPCAFLRPEDNTMVTADFLVTDYKLPRFQWTRPVSGGETPVWAEYSVTLREVNPHD